MNLRWQNIVRLINESQVGIPILILVILGMMTLPMPVFLLDALFTFNITLSIIILLVSLYALRPLDFGVFPTVLLVATLLRLALNVASTRIVLLEGHNGGDAAGKVIESFGTVLIGGNYVIGIIVFLILMIINFVVITKGAGRVSEVSARFTLDAMPGKQMAIDADLNAGLIDQDQARARREEIAREADFYGSMDGASKFVRGDAIAGIFILIINIIGGLIIGMLQHDLNFDQAIETYALLTIGDGLVAQIPSLMLSLATAIIVTRVNSSESIAQQVGMQMFASPRALYVSSSILFIMGVIPGMPHIPFLSLAFIVAGGSYLIDRYQKRQAADALLSEQEAETNKLPDVAEIDQKELGWQDVSSVDLLGLEVGYRLIPLVDRAQGGQLLGRIKGIRKKLSQDLGFLMPSVHIRDNLDLSPNSYRIILKAVSVGEAEVHPEREMAINPGQVYGPIEGIKGRDPAFGLEAVWIMPNQREEAQTLGYTVVDASTVIATQLNQIMQDHAYEMLGHDEVQKMVDILAETSPKLAEQLMPESVSLSALLKILQNLLLEHVPLRDMRSIAQAIVESAQSTKDPVQLTTAVRIALSRSIVQAITGPSEHLPVITLTPELEQMLLKSIQQAAQQGGDTDQLVMEPAMAEKLQASLSEAAQQQEMAGNAAVLVCAAPVRPVMARFVRYGIQNVHVLSYQEIPDNKQITIVATVG